MTNILRKTRKYYYNKIIENNKYERNLENPE